MCGIAGHFLNSDSTASSATALALLAIEMETRGDHSWGITNGTNLIKAVGPITGGYNVNAMRGPEQVLHTRWATCGARTKRNAHPFEVFGKLGRIVGVHNGVINNHHQMNIKYGRNCEVDSEHIFHHLVEDLPLDDLAGYGAIIYKLNDAWHIAKFNGGSMAVVETPAGLFAASTMQAIEWSLRLAGIPIEHELIIEDNTTYKVEGTDLTMVGRIQLGRSSTSWEDFRDRNKKITFDGDKWWKNFTGTKSLSAGNEETVEEIEAALAGEALEDAEDSNRVCSNCSTVCADVDDEGEPVDIFINLEDEVVCATCAVDEYSYVDKADVVEMNAGDWSEQGRVECDECGSIMIGTDQVVWLDKLHQTICKDCFDIEYVTKGLKKLSRQSESFTESVARASFS